MKEGSTAMKSCHQTLSEPNEVHDENTNHGHEERESSTMEPLEHIGNNNIDGSHDGSNCSPSEASHEPNVDNEEEAAVHGGASSGDVPAVGVADEETSTHHGLEAFDEDDCGRERLKRHRVEVAGRVWIPDMWGQEDLLKDWIDCSAQFDASLVHNGIMSARAALVQEVSRANSGGLSIENRC